MANHHHHKQTPHAIVKWPFRVDLPFAVYGSLVSLQSVDCPQDDAIQAFQNILFQKPQREK
jgi:hypothetical protein